MGRVMGLSMMAQNGAFPIGALLLAELVSATSVSTAMVPAGVLCSICSAIIAARPYVRSL